MYAIDLSVTFHCDTLTIPWELGFFELLLVHASSNAYISRLQMPGPSTTFH